MNILFVTHYNELYGANKSLIEQCSGLIKSGTNVFVAAPSDDTDFSKAIKEIGAKFFAIGAVSQYALTKIRKATLKNKLKDFVKFFFCVNEANTNARKLVKIIKENQIDIVHTNSSVILEGAIAAKKAKIPHVLHVRECITEAYNNRYSCPRYTKKNLYGYSKRIITISNAVKNYISPLVKDKKKIQVIYDSVSLGDKISCQTEPTQKKIFVSVGLVSKQKGFHHAIEAFAKMNSDAQNQSELWIVGGSVEEAYWQSLVNQINNYGLDDKIKLLGYRSDISALVANAYCGLTCSYMEGLGRTTIEYMLSGKPVIASNSGATPEIVHDGQNGLIYEYGKTDELSRKMEYIISNPDVAKDLGQAGKEYAEKEFSMERYTSSLVYLYAKIGRKRGAFGRILSKLSLKKMIVFESNPDFACNTYPVYEKIKSDPAFKKYKLVWAVKSIDKSRKCHMILKHPQGKIQKIKTHLYYNRAKCIISCNEIIGRKREEQLTIFLSHGSKTKKTKGICEIGQIVDYVACQSHFFDEVIKYEYGLLDDQLVYFGYPRCDYLYNSDKSICESFGFKPNSKYLIWLPTFRKNVLYAQNNVDSKYDSLDMPIIYDEETLRRFDEFLTTNNLYIIYKPHPVQNMSKAKSLQLNNFIIINDNDLKNKSLQLYEVISKSEGLITDYSSVYFDYLLMNKPIGTTNDDAEAWKNKRGFAFDLETIHDKTTERIPNYDALCKFIKNTINGVDEKKEEREKIKNLTNMYDDGDSTERVVEFIKQKLC
ncbi:MAG: CDP-glycerol glycerophosphotransferase family protein [Clostridia bacterium]|nr:CDP-glycerol glycerophosphotransferase family protein [Clostridia bacterium]